MCIGWIIQLETKQKLVTYHVEDHDEFYYFFALTFGLCLWDELHSKANKMGYLRGKRKMQR